MSYDLTARVIEAAPSGITPAERLVLLSIAHYESTEKGYCWASNEVLGRGAGLPVETVSRAITSLINKGLVSRTGGRYSRHLKINSNDLSSSRDDLSSLRNDLSSSRDDLSSTELGSNKDSTRKELASRLTPRAERKSHLRPVPNDNGKPLSALALAEYLTVDIMRLGRSRGMKAQGSVNKQALAGRIKQVRQEYELTDGDLLRMMDLYPDCEFLWQGSKHPAWTFLNGNTINGLRNMLEAGRVQEQAARGPAPKPQGETLAERRVREWREEQQAKEAQA